MFLYQVGFQELRVSEARNAQGFSAPVIPDKLYFRIGEVARLLDVETHTLRFWESEFPQLKVGKGGTGQRLYRRRDVELVLEIRRLLYDEGYTIPGARQMLQARQRREATRPKPESTAAPKVPPGPREASLDRLRSDLRELSNLLHGEPTMVRGAAEHEQPARRGSATLARRGLHLAPVPGKSRESRPSAKDGVAGRLPGLFDKEMQ